MFGLFVDGFFIEKNMDINYFFLGLNYIRIVFFCIKCGLDNISYIV